MNTPTLAQAVQLHHAGKLREAEDAYRQLLRPEPRSAQVWFALAQLCDTDHRPVEAVACFRQALEIDPQQAEGYFLLGNVLLQQGKNQEAEPMYRKCIELKPDHALALGNLGFIVNEQEHLDEAKSCFERALALRPDLAEVHHNLGNVLREQGKHDEALARYKTALQFRPEYAKAFINRGIALVALGRLDEAITDLKRGVELAPGLADAHTSLGAALSVQQRFDESLAHYATALKLKPDHAEAAWNQSLIWLLQGDYERGWPAYDWRWKCKRTTPLPAYKQPRWDGAPLGGRTILLYGEQGLGDVLHFVRYAPLVRERGGRVIVQCQNTLIPILSRTPGIDGLVAWGATPPAFDVWQPLMSLPTVFNTRLDTIPAQVPYIHPNPELVAHWRNQLAPVRGFRVGIAWQGSPRHAWDRHRSVALDAFEPLARIDGVNLISLQKGTGSESMRARAGRFSVLSLGELLDQASGPFMDTAAVLASLDLVVTVDTAIAHLAGAMGVPCWVALSYTPDWRWLLRRSDSLWYPTLRLFRQPRLGDWQSVFSEMADALKLEASKPTARRPIFTETTAADLLDRIAALEVACEQPTCADTLPNAKMQLANLHRLREATLGSAPEILMPLTRLTEAHRKLHLAEHELRFCHENQVHGERLVTAVQAFFTAKGVLAGLKSLLA
ncbi:MAG: glycosyltransferase family protein [Planctomycetes bacterium]|nr:glycosyltransferase family protein [Planctomycetota bacterium]